MNPAAKREFFALVAIETGWKSFVTEAELEELADYADLRIRLAGLRKLMRSALRQKDSNQVMALNREINATMQRAQRLAADLRLVDKETALMEQAERGE